MELASSNPKQSYVIYTSEFSFLKTGFLGMAKETSLTYYLLVGEHWLIHVFPMRIKLKLGCK